MIHILDACAMIAFLRHESGAEVIRDLLLDTDSLCYAHAINLCEVYYDAFRNSGEAKAEEALEQLSQVGIITRSDFDEAFWQNAGKIKAIHRRVSLADCLAIALTNRTGGTLITSDHHEMDSLATAGVCSINFFR